MGTRFSTRVRPQWFGLVAIAFVAAGMVATFSDGPVGARCDESGPADAARASGIVSVDISGNLIPPTPLELDLLEAEIAALVQHSADSLQIITESDGMQWVDLQGHYQALTVATGTEDGRVEVGCRITSATRRDEP
jgi:hypothetical protein